MLNCEHYGSPLVSVIIPSYNSEKYIKSSIQSILNQTFTNYEIIIINDASTDNTEKRILNFLKYKNIRYYKNNTNMGLSFSRNKGIKLSKGKYIALLDSDDLWLPHKLFYQINLFLSNPSLGMVYTDYYFLKKNKMIYQKTKKFFTNTTFNNLYKNNNFIHPSTVLIKKEVFEKIGAFDEKLTSIEDYDMWLKIAKNYKILGINKKLTVVRIHQNNMSHNVPIMLYNELNVIKKHQQKVETMVFIRRKAKVYFLNSDRYISLNKRKKALPLLLKGITFYPLLYPDIFIVIFKFILGNRIIHKIKENIKKFKILDKIYGKIFEKY